MTDFQAKKGSVQRFPKLRQEKRTRQGVKGECGSLWSAECTPGSRWPPIQFSLASTLANWTALWDNRKTCKINLQFFCALVCVLEKQKKK